MSEINKPDIRVEIIQANSNAAGLFSYVIKMVEYLRSLADTPILTTFDVEYWRGVQHKINTSEFSPTSNEFKEMTNTYLEDLLFNKTGHSFSESERRGNGVLESIFGGLMAFMREMQDASAHMAGARFSQSTKSIIENIEGPRETVKKHANHPKESTELGDIPNGSLASLEFLEGRAPSEDPDAQRREIMEDELVSVIKTTATHLAIAQLSRLALESMNAAYREDETGKHAFETMLHANEQSIAAARTSLDLMEEAATALHEIDENDENADPEDLETQADFIENLLLAKRLLPRLYSVAETPSDVFARVWNSLVIDAENNILERSREEVKEGHPECDNPDCLIRALGDMTVIPLYRRHVDQAAAPAPSSDNFSASALSVIDHVLLDVHNGALVMNLLVTFPAMDDAMQKLLDAAVDKRKHDIPEAMMKFLTDWKDRSDPSVAERVMTRLNNLTNEQDRLKEHRDEHRKLKNIEEKLAEQYPDKAVHAVLLHGAVQIMHVRLSLIENFMLQSEAELTGSETAEWTPEMFSE